MKIDSHMPPPAWLQVPGVGSSASGGEDMGNVSLDDAMTVLVGMVDSQASAQARTAERQVAGMADLRRGMTRRIQDALDEKLKNEGGKGVFDSVSDLVTDVTKDLLTGHIADAFNDSGGDLDQMVNSPRFWGDVKQIAMVVAEAAATIGSIASFGTASAGAAALIAVGIAMSAAGFAESNFQVLEKMGADPEVAKWVGIGVAIGGAACSLGAGALNAASAAGSAADAATQGTDAVAQASSTASRVGSAMSAVGGGASIVGGGAGIATSVFAYNAAQAEIAAEKARQHSAFIERLAEAIVADLKSDEKRDEKDRQTAVKGVEASNQTQLAAVMRA